MLGKPCTDFFSDERAARFGFTIVSAELNA